MELEDTTEVIRSHQSVKELEDTTDVIRSHQSVMELEDTTDVIRSHQSVKVIHYNRQKKKGQNDKNNIQKNTTQEYND